MARVLVVGSAVLDFVYQMVAHPTSAEKYKADSVDIVGGGCAANAAVAIARLGGEARLLARFGDDYVRDLICDDLRAEGVDLSMIEVSAGKSAMSSVYVDARGERQLMAFRGGGLVEAPRSFSATKDVVLADTRWPEAALVAFASTSAARVLDGEAPVPEALAQAASHVIFSEQGLLDYAGATEVEAALPATAEKLDAWVAVTCGARGTYWIEGGAYHHLPAFEVDVKDTLGAGDIWHGTFALWLAEGHSAHDAIRAASAAAAIKCTGRGRQAAPMRAEVEKFLKDRT